MQEIRVIDSHTGGEPTRVVIAGGPDLGRGPLAERRDGFAPSSTTSARRSSTSRAARMPRWARCSASPWTRTAARASSSSTTSATSACAATAPSASWSRSPTSAGSRPGRHRLETPVGMVAAELHADQRVTVTNVPSYRHRGGRERRRAGPRPRHRRRRLGRQLVLPVSDHGQELGARPTREPSPTTPRRIRQALLAAGVRGATAPRSTTSSCSARRPTRAPTAATSCSAPARPTTARPAAPAPAPSSRASHADGKLRPGEVWRQESIIGSVFEGRFDGRPAARPATSCPRSPARPTSRPKRPCCSTSAIPSAWGVRDGR